MYKKIALISIMMFFNTTEMEPFENDSNALVFVFSVESTLIMHLFLSVVLYL